MGLRIKTNLETFGLLSWGFKFVFFYGKILGNL